MPGSTEDLCGQFLTTGVARFDYSVLRGDGHSLSIFSSPFHSALGTFALFPRNSEASFHIVNDALDDEFTELLPPEV